MSINKYLLTLAIALATTGCANQAHQAAQAAENAERIAEQAGVSQPDTIGSSGGGGFSRNINRTVDAANNVACYTVTNGNGGKNISCVKL